jgi:hypothetical protein
MISQRVCLEADLEFICETYDSRHFWLAQCSKETRNLHWTTPASTRYSADLVHDEAPGIAFLARRYLYEPQVEVSVIFATAYSLVACTATRQEERSLGSG